MDRNDAVDDGSGYYGGGFRNRYDLRFWANYFLTDEQQLTFYAFFTDLEADRMPNSLPSAAQLTASGSSAYDYPNFKPGTQRSGSIEYNTRRAYGLGLAYNFIGKLAERDISLTTGIDFLHEVDHRQNYRGSVVTFPWGQGMWKDKQNLNNNLRTTIDTFSLFAEVNYQVLDQLKLRLGARYDSWNSELDDYSGNRLGISGHRSAISPKAGVLYQPLDWLEFFTSYGVSYSVPDPASSALTGFYSGSAELQKRDQIEVGYRASPLDWLEISSTAFWLFTTNDSTLDINGNTVYEGETLRQGLENSIRVMPLDYLLFSLDYTYLDARTRKGNVASGPTDGLRLTNSPRHLTSLQVSYAPPEGFGGFLKFHWTADWLSTSTPIATVKQTDRGYLDGQLSYRFNEKYKVRFDLTNILDQKFEQYNPDNTSTINPMPPRLFYLSFEVNYN
jgi:outer membrane receptor protein involved in Fe transport